MESQNKIKDKCHHDTPIEDKSIFDLIGKIEGYN